MKRDGKGRFVASKNNSIINALKNFIYIIGILILILPWIILFKSRITKRIVDIFAYIVNGIQVEACPDTTKPF